jgi:hypothetical protein
MELISPDSNTTKQNRTECPINTNQSAISHRETECIALPAASSSSVGSTVGIVFAILILLGGIIFLVASRVQKQTAQPTPKQRSTKQGATINNAPPAVPNPAFHITIEADAEYGEGYNPTGNAAQKLGTMRGCKYHCGFTGRKSALKEHEVRCITGDGDANAHEPATGEVVYSSDAGTEASSTVAGAVIDFYSVPAGKKGARPGGIAVQNGAAVSTYNTADHGNGGVTSAGPNVCSHAAHTIDKKNKKNKQKKKQSKGGSVHEANNFYDAGVPHPKEAKAAANNFYDAGAPQPKASKPAANNFYDAGVPQPKEAVHSRPRSSSNQARP